MVWLFNFSASSSGGGLRRLIETARWFDQNEGGYLKKKKKARQAVKNFANKNQFFEVSSNKLQRLINDGYYINDILKKIDFPDIYFSYGVPIFFSVGRVNWFHVSNALSLTTYNIDLPLKRKLEMILLRRRIIESMKFVQMVSAESNFSLNLIKERYTESRDIYFAILPNGYSELELQKHSRKTNNEKHFAITIGTLEYKQIGLAFRVFKMLQKSNPLLEKFIIIGDKQDVPRQIIESGEVEVDIGMNRDELIQWLYNAEYYISASQIENSSIGALEGLIFTKKVVLSDIPPHREMLQGINFDEIYEEQSGARLLIASYDPRKKISGICSWSQATQKFCELFENYATTSGFCSD